MVTKNPLDILAMGDNVTEKALYIVREREISTNALTVALRVLLNVLCTAILTLKTTFAETVW